MPFWRKGNRPAQLPGLLRSRSGRSPHLGERAFWALCLLAMIASAPTVARPFRGAARQKPTPKTTGAKKANELTLAGLRPGRDTVAKAKTKFGTKNMSATDGAIFWNCGDWKMTLDLDAHTAVRTVIVSDSTFGKNRPQTPPSHEAKNIPIPCYLQTTSTALSLERAEGLNLKNLWTTGKGLALGDPVERLTSLYGEPDSRSPSTKDGQPLELWYYAFDWAGPDVPQVMEVVCTREKDGQVGRVVEITLAAPSL
jgi:hypothetical protein